MEFKKLQKIIAEVLGIGDMEIFQEMSFVDDLGADSLELFQILMGVEQEFDISIDEESLKDVDTVGDLLELIC
ncbi:MAG: acyl carrier protein [Butyribacter sp.]|jgi:acyl carrier protein|uniref:Acyl carrier protein n=1 Tax=Butyribacter intestini TaxID=1703332 RepID=A0AAW3JQE7_9FIRM|nr:MULTISPECIES: acyl carrier protein [Clostridia]MBS5364374.1 acyl carrier protein [Clostridium sp.]MCQ5164643.1 acyl carrier protein [Roseburia hominis]OKZ80203.1 MAG: acyl carrier protein [Clostridium sp. CAG:12237_41]UYJ42029.1 MAG: acyl carrier protein [Lachnospiraceae bacterium]CCZ41500.1 acyl carrier protein 2 [Clostridium sp. CAG:122]